MTMAAVTMAAGGVASPAGWGEAALAGAGAEGARVAESVGVRAVAAAMEPAAASAEAPPAGVGRAAAGTARGVAAWRAKESPMEDGWERIPTEGMRGASHGGCVWGEVPWRVGEG